MKLEVYTDGSATTKDKPGGYGWVIIRDGIFLSEGSGSLEKATNNDAELEAAIMGLANAYKIVSDKPIFPVDWMPTKYEVILVSDSQIVLGWLSGTYRFKQLAKQQKYFQFMRLKKMMGVTGRWVEGHTGDEWNERCDKLAGVERRRAMGIETKPRVNKSKLLREACEKMAEELEFVKRREAKFDLPNEPMLRGIDEALEFYRKIT